MVSLLLVLFGVKFGMCDCVSVVLKLMLLFSLMVRCLMNIDVLNDMYGLMLYEVVKFRLIVFRLVLRLL